MPTKNPYYEAVKSNPDIFSSAGQGLDLLQGDVNVYGRNRNFENIDQIGSTGVGRGLSGLGSAAMSTGTPVGMIGGLAAKGLGGGIDFINYLGQDAPDLITSYKGDDFSYDLGDEALDISEIDPSKVGMQAAGKLAGTGAAAGAAFGPIGSAIGAIGGAIGGFFGGKRKAKKLKKESQAKLEKAQGKYNQANIDRATRQSARESFMPTTRPALFSSGYSDIFGQF